MINIMNINLKIPFISLVVFFSMGCDSVQSVQKENPLVNALFKNGIDISNDMDMNHNNYNLNKKQAICIVKNIENLSNDREWERFVYEELEMDEKTDVDYLEDGFSILGDVLQGEFDSMFDGLKVSKHQLVNQLVQSIKYVVKLSLISMEIIYTMTTYTMTIQKIVIKMKL